MRWHGFTLVEVLVVIVVLGILASVAAVAATGESEHRRTVTLMQSLEEVRGYLARYRTDAVLTATTDFPDLGVVDLGTLLPSGRVPENPFTGSSTVTIATARATAQSRTVQGGAAGWVYYADSGSDPAAWFYANSSHPTTQTNPATGAVLNANEL